MGVLWSDKNKIRITERHHGTEKDTRKKSLESQPSLGKSKLIVGLSPEGGRCFAADVDLLSAIPNPYTTPEVIVNCFATRDPVSFRLPDWLTDKMRLKRLDLE